MILNDSVKSLEDEVFGILLEDIISGVYKSGESLTELSVCKRLGVSRTPVRAAFARLAEEGLISISPNRTPRVIGVGPEDLIDAYRIRIRLEGLSSAMATERLSEVDKKELCEIVELSEFYVGKGDVEHLKELDTRFHSVIYRASGSRMLCSILTMIHRNIRGYRRKSLLVPGRVEASVKEHREILEAMLTGDGALADELTRRHIERAMENITSSQE